MIRPRLFLLGASIFVTVVRAVDTVPASPAAIQQELKSFATVGTVLHVAAHPDDENRALIAFLSLGRGYRTGYLSITRGDGGQNEIGPEFGEKLGVARTQELLAGRRLDGARQFFTRALDFGYSKDVKEALASWDHQQVLADVVRVIRTFRPDVIVTRFSPVAGNTHGHHTASAVLALEAFKIAGDPKEFPEQIAEGLLPWQPKRILQNGGGGGRGGGGGGAGALSIEAGGNDPVSGESFTAIAGRTSSMHKTQGFGGGGGRGGGGGGPRPEYFSLLDGEPATKDILDGVDTTWARFPGGAEIAALTGAAIAQFKTEDPAASVPALLAIRAKLASVAKGDPVADDKRAQLDRIVQACLGLVVTTTLENPEIAPGEPVKMRESVSLAANVPVRLVERRYGALAQMQSTVTVDTPTGARTAMLQPGGPATTRDVSLLLPKDFPVSQPYWLRAEGTAGMFRVDEAKLIGLPVNPPALPIDYVFEVGGQTLVVHDEPMTAGRPDAPARELVVISPVSLGFEAEAALFAPGATKPVVVDVTSARPNAEGALRLEAPAGWRVAPAEQKFQLAKTGDKTRLTFTVTAPAQVGSGGLQAVVRIDGRNYSNGRVDIRYAHIPVQVLQSAARLKAVAFNLAIRGQKIGYLPGAGDSVAVCLQQMGYEVKELVGADLTPEKLRGFDAVVIGVRAFNERTDLAANLDGLFAWVETGGTVVAQYNRPNGLNTPRLGPYALSIQGSAPALRVTDEHSPVLVLAPDSPVFTTPNRIGPADFEGWVQERGAYFPSSWDEKHYTPVLAMNDPGEAMLKSSVLVAKHGKGYFVYTGLGFFRQLPAGVPGAYRLFANLVSLGKE